MQGIALETSHVVLTIKHNLLPVSALVEWTCRQGLGVLQVAEVGVPPRD